MKVFVLVLHGVSAMLLLGAITHQALALWWPKHGADSGWWNSLRAVHPERYVQATLMLFCITAALGAIGYVPFSAITRVQYLDLHAPWATGLFEIKEHASAIALALLPAYWAAWREPENHGARRAFTTFLAIVTWWNFIVGHIVNNVRGL